MSEDNRPPNESTRTALTEPATKPALARRKRASDDELCYRFNLIPWQPHSWPDSSVRPSGLVLSTSREQLAVDKVEGPAPFLTFGIELNTITVSFGLPLDKMASLCI